MKLVKPSAIRELLQFGENPEIISFAGGYPDPMLFPVENLREIVNRTLKNNGRSALQYTVSNGIPNLRAQIAQKMTGEGAPCTADEILILQGGQQGLDLVAKMLINPGDLIITEHPTFLGAMIAFNPCQPRYESVEMDASGMSVDHLEETLKRNGAPKFLYTTPDFHNPTGVTLTLVRRKRLVELANEFDFIIVEDSPYRDLRYEGTSVPPIKSFDTEGRVIYLGSFSKVLAPGLRIGWAAGSKKIIESLGLLKLAADTQTSTLNMFTVSTFLEEYDVNELLQEIRRTYRRKKDLMLETIRQTFPQEVECTDPHGGLFTWLTFERGFDAAKFMSETALPVAKVAYVPGAPFYPLEAEANHARLSYSLQSDELLTEGLTRLGKALKQGR
ncbi:PLP-dependent aminotransferase family protein [Mesorhizobium sp. AaZ16]|uniref:aminotransferase-like domain-containing protein n=1 Tax=Mesorhizobium sp. AaZ16 TaxID=3402289 RepID=UPI00374E75EC